MLQSGYEREIISLKQAIQVRNQYLKQWQEYCESITRERDHLQREVTRLNGIITQMSAEKERLLSGYVDPANKRLINEIQGLRQGALSGRESRVWQVLVAAERPPYLQELIAATKLPHSSVGHALDGLRRKGFVTHRKTGSRHYFYPLPTKLPPNHPPNQEILQSRKNGEDASVGVSGCQSAESAEVKDSG